MVRYLSLIVKNSIRNRRRTSLTVASIAVSLCLLGLLFAIYRAFFFSEPLPGQELRLITRHKVSLANPLPEFYSQRIQQVPGVREVTIWQWFGGIYKDSRDSRNFFAQFGVQPEKFLTTRPTIRLPDEQRQAFLRERTACIATKDLVERFGWPLGERTVWHTDAHGAGVRPSAD